MSRVLIVDDEQDCRDELELALSADGHEVRGAESGRRGIDVGARFRPEVLVADWMLKNHFHGLHVSDALRSVTPAIQTILITGFASEDLKADADRAHIFDFIEKPFELKRIQQGVRDAAQAAMAAPTGRQSPGPALLEIDADGRILFANGSASAMFAQSRIHPMPRHVGELCSDDWWPNCWEAALQWIPMTLQAASDVRWLMCAQPVPVDGTRLVAMRADDDAPHAHVASVQMLLAATDDAEADWPLKGRVLVVDDEPMLRRVITATLEFAGARCFAAGTHVDALRLFKHDEGIECVIVDYTMPEGDVAGFVGRLKSIRPGAVIVGNSATARSDEFLQAGVERFLAKPWRIEDLVQVLVGPIGQCPRCGLALPLRRGSSDDDVVAWACCGCGTRFQAVFDNDAAPDTFGNARRIDTPAS